MAFFFFQAEDGIRGFHVTGVQTCALPILAASFVPYKATLNPNQKPTTKPPNKNSQQTQSIIHHPPPFSAAINSFIFDAISSAVAVVGSSIGSTAVGMAAFPSSAACRFVTSLMEWVCDCGGNVEGLLVTPDQGTDSAASTIPLSFWSYTSFFISPPPPPTFCN